MYSSRILRANFLAQLAFIFILIPHVLIGQKITPVFGTISDAEHALIAPVNEPDADAVVVFDIGASRFNSEGTEGFSIRFTRMKRIKILTRGGAKHAEFSIPFYREDLDNTETVESVEAITYNEENGHIIMRKLDPATIFEERIGPRWLVKKFVMPDVKEGTVIDVRYAVETPFLFNLPDWKFQNAIPTRYSEYSVGMTPFYEYDFIAQGMTKFDLQTTEPEFPKKSYGGVRYNDMVTTFVLKDVPSFTDESFISSPEDFVMKIDFQLSKHNRLDGTYKLYRTTWKDLNKSLLELSYFGKYLNASNRLAKDILSKDIRLANVPEATRAQAIVNYIRTSFTWDGVNSHLALKSAKEVYVQKKGNSAELNLMLVALLTEAGFDAYPVILSTRDHGKVQIEYPFDHYFNYVLVFVNGDKPFLADGTENKMPYDRVPLRCLNGQGLIVSKEGENWVSLEPKAPSMEDISLSLSLNGEKLSATVSGTIQATEYEASRYRSQFQNDSLRVRKYFLEEHQVQVSEISLINYDKSQLPYVVTFKGTVPLEKIGNKVIVQPLLRFPMKENPLRQEARNYPVDFIYLQNSSIKATLLVPEGYKIESLPDAITMQNEMAQITLTHKLNGRELTIQANYALKKIIYSPAEYSKLRFYLGMIVKNFNAPIVLNKL
jgi:hypothetical protein